MRPAILLTVGVSIGQVIAWLVRGAPHRRNQGPVCFNMKAAEIPRFATTMIAVVGAASLCIAPMTFAQSGDGASPSASESVIIPGPPTSAADELSGPSASAAGGSSGTLDDSSGSPPASRTDWEEVPETNSDATSGEGQVLEIPQSVDPNQAAAPESKSPAQASNDGQGDESAEAPDELGGLNDYQSQNAEVSGGYLIPVPVLVPVPVSPGFAAGPRMGAPTQPAPGMGGVGPISPPFPPGGFRPTPPIVLRPGGFAGIPSTSPMLTPPSGSTAMPGGWWTRTH
jgi:hypothetical protein